MSDILCGECKNHYKRGDWHCWSGNRSLGYCHYNAEPHPLARYWNYSYKRGKVFAYREIEKIEKRRNGDE